MFWMCTWKQGSERIIDSAWQKIGNIPFQEPIVHQANASREHLLDNNHNHGSTPQKFNKIIDTSMLGPTKATIYNNKPKMNLVSFVEPYGCINPTDNINNYTNLVDAHKEHTIEDPE